MHCVISHTKTYLGETGKIPVNYIDNYIMSTRQNVLKFDLKSPGFVPFGANLTHFGARSTIPGRRSHLEKDIQFFHITLPVEDIRVGPE